MSNCMPTNWVTQKGQIPRKIQITKTDSRKKKNKILNRPFKVKKFHQ